MLDLDVWRAAHKMVGLYEFEAGFIAAQRADALYEQGDINGFQVWTRIVAAIAKLQPTVPAGGDFRH